MECQQCREDLINKIGESAKCTKAVGTKLDSKLSLRNFGIAIFFLAAPIFIYLISLNVMVADCADEDSQVEFEKFVIESVTRIEGSVVNNEQTFNRLEKRMGRIEDKGSERDKRLRIVERAIDSEHHDDYN